MGKVKAILEDTSVEEFEVMREKLLNPRKDLTVDNMNEYEMEAFNYVYDVWLSIEGTDKANELLKEYGGYITTYRLTEFTNELLRIFMSWLRDYK